MPHDLTQFLADRGIELRLRPHGSGPTLWTLTNAAAAVAEQEGWHDGARGAFLDSMMEAAATSALKVRDPRTDLVARPGVIRSDWELININDLNEWLAAQDAPYRWNLVSPLAAVSKTSPRDFRPWETLPKVFNVIDGVYLYQQAARQIADAEGWDDSKLEAFEARMRDAANTGTLKIRCRKTGMVIEPNVLDSLMLVSVDDVNEWLKNEGVNYRWAAGIEVTRESWWASTVESDEQNTTPEYQAKLARAHEIHAGLETWRAMKHQNDPDKYEKILAKIAQLESELAALNASPQSTEPILRQQEEVIIGWLRENDYDPKNLPQVKNGMRTSKAYAKAALKGSRLFSGRTTFEKAWERLRGFGEIGEGEPKLES